MSTITEDRLRPAEHKFIKRICAAGFRRLPDAGFTLRFKRDRTTVAVEVRFGRHDPPNLVVVELDDHERFIRIESLHDGSAWIKVFTRDEDGKGSHEQRWAVTVNTWEKHPLVELPAVAERLATETFLGSLPAIPVPVHRPGQDS